MNNLPPGTQEAARLFWDSLSPVDRREIENLIGALPSEAGLMRLLVRLATHQFRTTFGKKSKVVIVGPANVGKSTLYNQLVRRREDRAEVSPLPGTTRQNQVADAGLFTVVDTPGADAVGEVGEHEQTLALQAAQEADFLIIVFDAIQGIKRTELELYERLVALGKPYVVALNKVDLVRRDSKKVVEAAANALSLAYDQVIPIVAKSGENMDDILAAIAATEPEIVAALGQALPHYRWQLAWRTIVSAASASAVIALTPLPVIDFIPLTITQSLMVLGIARIYTYQITLARARELVVSFGLGFLGRTLFQQLSKLGGVPGWFLSAAIAASTTVVMGYAASVWFETGERLSSQAIRQITREVTGYLLDRLKTLGRKKPSQESFKQRVEETLEQAPMAQDRSVLDRQAQETRESENQDPANPTSRR